MLQILETKLWEIRHNRFGYTSYAPSYSSATPSFVKEKVPAPHLPITSPPWLSSLQSCIQLHLPLPPQEENTLPSFLLKEKTILPHLLPFPCASCYNNSNQRTHEPVQVHPHISRRDKPPLPFLWRHPAHTPMYVFSKTVWQWDLNYLEHEII